MNDASFIVPLIVVAVLTTLTYYRGRKKNRWISAWISREAEEALRPVDTEYVNFGGVIGYNFVYKMREPFREAKGTFTLLPRHSLFFIPISFLFLTRHDRYYVHLYTGARLAGEGHIIGKGYFPKAARMITGIDGMQRGDAYCNGRQYVLLWKGRDMEEKLRHLLSGLENPQMLLHFCCYAENRTFFLFVKPLRLKLGELLKSYVPGLRPFFMKGGTFDDSGSSEKN
ncbi:MAG: hypothetical protein LBK13_06465 [Spirochaetales bacterium]|jgi:hypothetical protein|nr:hypothetical protein [Spirochaetales bacterium]